MYWGCGARPVERLPLPSFSGSVLPPTTHKREAAQGPDVCARGGALRLWWGPRNLWQPRRPPVSNVGRLARRRGDGGAFDGWNHLDFVEKRPASQGRFCNLSSFAEEKSETHFLEGRSCRPSGRPDAPPPPAPWLRGPHGRSGTSIEVSGSRRGNPFWGVQLSGAPVRIAWRRGWVSGRQTSAAHADCGSER